MKPIFKQLSIVSLSVVIIGITVLSLLPPKSGVELGSHDKINHLIAYSVFSFNLGWVLQSWKQHLKWLIFPIFYGVIMEYCQGFVPGREVSLLDAMANATGAVCGFLVMTLVGRLIRF